MTTLWSPSEVELGELGVIQARPRVDASTSCSPCCRVGVLGDLAHVPDVWGALLLVAWFWVCVPLTACLVLTFNTKILKMVARRRTKDPKNLALDNVRTTVVFQRTRPSSDAPAVATDSSNFHGGTVATMKSSSNSQVINKKRTCIVAHVQKRWRFRAENSIRNRIGLCCTVQRDSSCAVFFK
jgi:hypothetical protein